jgi:hypothetical protein
MAAPARAPAPQPESTASRQSSPSPMTRRGAGVAPAGPPLVRLGAPKRPGAPRPRVATVSHVPPGPAGPGQPAIALAGAGDPLPADVRTHLEAGFGADLGDVRVHQGDSASHLAIAHGARAFAYGNHIVLGEKASPRDVGLMAHEVAHVLQQRGSPAVQRCANGTCTCGGACRSGSANEDEAARASQTVAAGGSFNVTGRTSSIAAQHADEDEGWLERTIWGLLESHAPSLVPIIRKGPAGVLDSVKDKVTGAVRSRHRRRRRVPAHPLRAAHRLDAGRGGEDRAERLQADQRGDPED